MNHELSFFCHIYEAHGLLELGVSEPVVQRPLLLATLTCSSFPAIFRLQSVLQLERLCGINELTWLFFAQ